MNPGYICMAPLTPREPILVEPLKGGPEEVAAKWLGSENLRRTRENCQSETWEGETESLGMCTGPFLGLCWEALSSGVNHAQGGASSDRQQTS